MTSGLSALPGRMIEAADWLDAADVDAAALIDPRGILIEAQSRPLFVGSIAAMAAPCIFGRGSVYRSGLMMPWTVIGRYSTIADSVDIGAPAFTATGLTAADRSIVSIVAPDDADSPVTVIGCDVRIGVRATIVRGVRIGHGAIVAPHAVVSVDIPPYAVAMGNPATVQRFRFSPEAIEQKLEASWWRPRPDRAPAIRRAGPAPTSDPTVRP